MNVISYEEVILKIHYEEKDKTRTTKSHEVA
nr:MAG TPA: hypothetical protein [Caudoviricetes sp.]